MSVRSHGRTVDPATGYSTPPSYISDALSRETVQFQDLQVFKQYPNPQSIRSHQTLMDHLVQEQEHEMQRRMDIGTGPRTSSRMSTSTLVTRQEQSPIAADPNQNQNDSSRGSNSVSGDSGFSDHGHGQNVDKLYLDQQSLALTKELKTVLKLSDDFLRDVDNSGENSRDLLIELEKKIRPFLIQLDEKVVSQEEIIKKNVDKCVVTDARVSWLLHYNGFMLRFRQLIEKLIIDVYDKIEENLRVKVRGCSGVIFDVLNIKKQLVKFDEYLDHLDADIKIEMTKHEVEYEKAKHDQP